YNNTSELERFSKGAQSEQRKIFFPKSHIATWPVEINPVHASHGYNNHYFLSAAAVSLSYFHLLINAQQFLSKSIISTRANVQKFPLSRSMLKKLCYSVHYFSTVEDDMS
uniref:Uncharacterized protein n=1 Tax=Romanomermis culicivorax TaxID=13658 RepID=A0A915L331_ROMCU